MSNVTALPVSDGGAREEIASAIRAHLAVRKINDSELARRTGMSQTQITRRTNGRLPFDADDLGRIASTLGLSVVELIQMPTKLPAVDSNHQPTGSRIAQVTSLTDRLPKAPARTRETPAVVSLIGVGR